MLFPEEKLHLKIEHQKMCMKGQKFEDFVKKTSSKIIISLLF